MSVIAGIALGGQCLAKLADSEGQIHNNGELFLSDLQIRTLTATVRKRPAALPSSAIGNGSRLFNTLADVTFWERAVRQKLNLKSTSERLVQGM